MEPAEISVSRRQGASPFAGELRSAELDQFRQELVPGQDGQTRGVLKDGYHRPPAMDGKNGNRAIIGVAAQTSCSGEDLPKLVGRHSRRDLKPFGKALDSVPREADRTVVTLSWWCHRGAPLRSEAVKDQLTIINPKIRINVNRFFEGYNIH